MNTKTLLEKIKMKGKRGVISLGEVPSVVLVLVVIAIFLAIGALILNQIGSNSLFTTGSAAKNATDAGQAGLNTIGSFQTIIAVVVAAAVILGIVFLIQR